MSLRVGGAPSLLIRSETPEGAPQLRLNLDQVPLPRYATAELEAARQRGRTRQPEESREGWLGYMASLFAAGVVTSERDRARTIEALGELSLADVRAFKRSLVDGHPRAWELVGSEALKDNIEGDRKQGQIQKILELLDGTVFANSAPHRRELAEATMVFRNAERALEADHLSLSELNRITGTLSAAEARLHQIRQPLENDPQATREANRLRERMETVRKIVAPLETAIEAENGADPRSHQGQELGQGRPPADPPG